MPAVLALLSLLGACSGMLDLPDQPRVSAETTAPLEPPPHGAHDGASIFRQPRAWPGAGGTSAMESAGASTADAGADDAEDGGLDVRLGSG
jgi:hypothetical protein